MQLRLLLDRLGVVVPLAVLPSPRSPVAAV